jgi:hypothetical protein
MPTLVCTTNDPYADPLPREQPTHARRSPSYAMCGASAFEERLLWAAFRDRPTCGLCRAAIQRRANRRTERAAVDQRTAVRMAKEAERRERDRTKAARRRVVKMVNIASKPSQPPPCPHHGDI